MTYETCKTYVHTFPVFYSNTTYGSLIHPDHLQSHEYANNIIKIIPATTRTDQGQYFVLGTDS